MSHARPRTPPRSASSGGNARHVLSPPARLAGKTTSPPHQSYASILSHGVGGWSNDNEVEDEDDDDEIVYDDDEDEFGLPSITSMRRKGKETRNIQREDNDLGGGNDRNLSSIAFDLGSARQRANSSDIAEERGVPLYPSTKKSEGKILRPQYKDILRGKAYLL
jgi:hypothetical protein